LLYTNYAHSNTLTFSAVEEDLIAVKEISGILKEAYGKLDMKFRLRRLPLERALMYSNNGTTDGELYRISDINRDYKNLIMVNVPLFRAEIVGFVKKYKGKITGMDSLKGKKICIVKGLKITELMTQGMSPSVEFTFEKLFKALDQDMCEVAVTDKKEGVAFLKKHMKTSGIRIGSDLLASVRLYHYLNVKHKVLVPKITKVLKSMVDSGKLKRYR
jgi:polar amino acid transport system substrate-binding protein